MLVTRSRSSSSARKDFPQNTQPDLTPSTKTKLSMLPELKRQRMLEDQSKLKHTASSKNVSNDSDGSVEQSLDQLSRLSHNDLKTKYASSAPKRKVQYIISNHSLVSSPSASFHHTASDDAMPSRSSTESGGNSQFTYSTRITGFSVHEGEKAITNPPIITDDVNSRLEGLRCFKEWSTRIHANAQSHEKSLSAAKSRAAIAPMEHTQVKETVESVPSFLGGFNLDQSTMDAPTPSSSPQIIPVPPTLIQRSRSSSPPALDLQASILPESTSHVQSVTRSRSVTISYNPPMSRSVSRSRSQSRPSRSSSRCASSQQEAEALATHTRLHPPISFPKGFYERHEHTNDPNVTSKQEQSCSSRNKPLLTPRVSPRTVAESSQCEPPAEDKIEPLATPCDARGRPTFYTTIHYFTDCPHTCPPANRPLDPKAQPRTDPDFHLFNSAITRSIIPGPCFNCDVAQRRTQESDVINANTAHVAELTNELAQLLDQLEIDTSEDERDSYLHDKHSARLLTSSTFREDKHDIDLETKGIKKLPPLSDDPEVASVLRPRKKRTADERSFQERITIRIRHIEAKLDRLRDEQDEQVKRVWRGFTSRWGPATLGVQRGAQASNARPSTIARSDSRSSKQSERSTTDGANNVQVVKVDAGGSTSDERARSRTRGRSPYSDNKSTKSTVSARDMPGSRSPGNGRMRIGWIREDKEQGVIVRETSD